MDLARELREFSEPATVVAKAQTKGRGRYDRTWISPPRGGLYLTVRLPWKERPLAQAPLVSLGCALALHRTCRSLGIGTASLKWPNDLLVGGRKAAGILAEMIQQDEQAVLLVGVGINVATGPEVLETVGQPATSLALAAGRDLDPEKVLSLFLGHWTEVDLCLESSGFGRLAQEYRDCSDVVGRSFLLSGSGPLRKVEVREIGDDGALIILDPATGQCTPLFGGELLPLPRNGTGQGLIGGGIFEPDGLPIARQRSCHPGRRLGPRPAFRCVVG